MTMLVDRRKDNYDELLVLANDSRASRARANRWTTGLVVGAMAAMAAFVATMNQQVDELRKNAGEAEAAYENLVTERDALKAEWEVLARYQELYADIVPTQGLSKSIARIAARSVPGEDSEGTTTVVTQFALSNIVWMVDGSRRFPMIDGDILWIPEGNFWVELEGKTVAEHKLYLSRTKPVGAADSSRKELRLPSSKNKATVGSSDCIEIILHKESLRPVFRDAGYVDIELIYFKSDNINKCGDD